MSRIVRITTGARLHFGPLAAAGAAGGAFGGVGMMITSPGYVVTARSAEIDRVSGPMPARARAETFLARVRQLVTQTSGISLEISEVIPAHAGLGSGTQLGLAVARCVSELSGEVDVAVDELARRAGRGLRSAIGLHGFAAGGFLVDGGRGPAQDLGTLVARLDFPKQWHWVLIAPRRGEGLSGMAEQAAFERQPGMPNALTGELCRIALMEWMPGLISLDFERVARAVETFGTRVGEFFAPIQGGIFADPLIRDLAQFLAQLGYRGIAQTSWGPTIGVLCESHSRGEALITAVTAEPHWANCDLRLVAPLNQGALVERL